MARMLAAEADASATPEMIEQMRAARCEGPAGLPPGGMPKLPGSAAGLPDWAAPHPSFHGFRFSGEEEVGSPGPSVGDIAQWRCPREANGRATGLSEREKDAANDREDPLLPCGAKKRPTTTWSPPTARAARRPRYIEQIGLKSVAEARRTQRVKLDSSAASNWLSSARSQRIASSLLDAADS